MKKKYLVVSLYLVNIVLSSCSWYKNYKQWSSGYFRTGEFVGDCSFYKDGEWVDSSLKRAASFTVINISEQQFFESNGIDVVKDINGGSDPYFRVNLQLKLEDSTLLDFHFNNLIVNRGKWISYLDDNNNQITPGFEDDSNLYWINLILENNQLADSISFNFDQKVN